MNEFNSQVCTSIEQSKRLLKLGLKPETADMAHEYIEAEYCWLIVSYDWSLRSMSEELIPAWSLHRLIEIYVCQFGSCLVNLKNLTFNWMVDEMETRFNYIKSLW